jgi:hypothetical protein
MNKINKYLLPFSAVLLAVYFTLWLMSSVAGWLPGGSYLDFSSGRSYDRT